MTRRARQGSTIKPMNTGNLSAFLFWDQESDRPMRWNRSQSRKLGKLSRKMGRWRQKRALKFSREDQGGCGTPENIHVVWIVRWTQLIFDLLFQLEVYDSMEYFILSLGKRVRVEVIMELFSGSSAQMFSSKSEQQTPHDRSRWLSRSR